MKIVVHPDNTVGTREALEARLDIEWSFPDDEDGVRAALADGAPVLVTGVWDDAYLHPTLRWVQGLGAGYEQFPLETIREAGVVFANATGCHPSVAEHAFGLLLSLTRNIAPAVRDAMSRTWSPPPLMDDLEGKTMTILGFGYVGEEIARRAAGWGMRVIGVKRDPARHAGHADEVVGLDELDEACRRADILVVVVPNAPGTRGLVGARQLDLLGHGWLVNVGRGAVVDEQAMIERLTDGRLAGAGLDVFAVEPLPVSSPLWELPNVVITPHTAGESPGYSIRFADLVAHNLAAWRGEADWRNRIC